MTAAHWLLLAAFAGFAVLWLLWRWRRPRVRAFDAEKDWSLTNVAGPLSEHEQGRIRAADEGEWQDQALDIATEADRAKAAHLNAAMRRLIGNSPISEDRKSGLLGEWHDRLEHTVPWPHTTAEEAADCAVCSPSSLPRRIEGGDEHG